MDDGGGIVFYLESKSISAVNYNPITEESFQSLSIAIPVRSSICPQFFSPDIPMIHLLNFHLLLLQPSSSQPVSHSMLAFWDPMMRPVSCEFSSALNSGQKSRSPSAAHHRILPSSPSPSSSLRGSRSSTGISRRIGTGFWRSWL